MASCGRCGRTLETGDRWSIDCGGDCWACMWEAEEDCQYEDRASTAALDHYAERGWWFLWSEYKREVYADRKAARFRRSA